MTPAISLVIVSQKRPMELERAIASLSFQSIVNFEIIVVADFPPMMKNIIVQDVRYFEFQEANISRARNIGIAEARAQIVAFCDDDAIPDPHWLERLCAPFYTDNKLGASTGFCRGRNGISYQWKGIGFSSTAKDFNLDIPIGAEPKIYEPRKDSYIKTIGTNCAFRKSALHDVGGFDESFHYFLEDADINLRLQQKGWKTAVVPQAEIIHNYKESRGRARNRVPKTLYNLGASTHHFLKKHASDMRLENLETFYKEQEDRLRNFFHLGLIRPKQIRALLRDLRRGVDGGADRESKHPLEKIRSTRLSQMKPRELTLDLSLSEPRGQYDNRVPIHVKINPTTQATRLTFRRKGYWRITTGRFGRLDRSEPYWKYRSHETAMARIKSFLEPRFTK